MSENLKQTRRHDRSSASGQALVETVLIIPIILVVVLAVAEVGVIFGKLNTLGYASREGARTGSALARGDVAECAPGNQDPSQVDAVLVAAVQRILKSPDSGIDTADINAVRIFSADSSGDPLPQTMHTWKYSGAGAGPVVDLGPPVARIDFVATEVASTWEACDRINTGVSPDSIGVTVSYDHRWATPLLQFVDGFAGGGLDLKLTETTVMALNPT